VPRKGKIETNLRQAGIKTYRINFDWWARGTNGRQPSFNKYRANNGEAVIEMGKILEKEKPIACVSYTAVFPWLAYAASICNIPHIWQVCEMLDDEKNWSLRLPKQKLYGIIDILSAKIFANSKVCKEHVDRFIKGRTEEVEVIYPYINQSRVLSLSQEKSPIMPNNSFKVCLIGNIQPSKGQLDAVKALAELRQRGHDAGLILVGRVMSDRYLDEIQKYARKNGISGSIHITAHVDNPHIYVKNSDVALVCSPHEAFGRVTIEAMTVGTPVVGANSDGTKEIIGNQDRFGLLYEAGNSDGLAKQIEKLIVNDGLRQRLSHDAQQYVATKFTRENNQRPFFDYLARLNHDEDKNHPPFTDILLAYKKYVALERDKIGELRTQNAALTKELNEISSSKKWLLVNKISRAVNIFRTFHISPKTRLNRIYRKYLLSSRFQFKNLSDRRPSKSNHAIIVCLWKRFDRIDKLISQLDNQKNGESKIDIYVWNNNFGARRRFEREIAKYKPSRNINSIQIYHSKVNVGGFGRFYTARKLMPTQDFVTFLDDDQNVSQDFINDTVSILKRKQLASYWAFAIKSDYYWDRRRIHYGERGDYCGTGGMVVDASIFSNDKLFDCPEKYWFIEDLWLSYYAKKLGWKLTGLDTDIDFVMAEQDQGRGIFDLKAEFYRFLNNQRV
jgi:glycosyltransferase involved in cell wall biosynthesis